MKLGESPAREDLLRRVRRIEGQARGIARMVEEDRDCGEILQQLEASSGKAVRIDPEMPQQLALFPETNPLLSELNQLDMNTLSPIEALNKLYEWKRKYLQDGE